MKQEIKMAFNPIGKEVWKNHKVKGIITAFDGKSVIDIKFEDEPELTKQYLLRALWGYQLSTEDKELLDFISKMICVDGLNQLEISDTYINDFVKNDTAFFFDGRDAKKITTKTEPELYLKLKGLEKRKSTKIFGVFNVPTRYGEKSDCYAFLDAELFKTYPPRRQGNVINAVVLFWNIETGESGEKRCGFQLSNGGIWCIPFEF